MRISVITPTFGRERFLPSLYRCFADQTHEPRELLVYDDSPAPSPFFATLSDARVRYLHAPARLTIGEKRNRLIDLAHGDVIAQFDDDDHYAPGYLAAMASALGDADLVKLSGWFALSIPDDAFFFWDTANNHPLHYKVGEGAVGFVTSSQFKPDFAAKNVDGYGFSYVFRRAAAARIAGGAFAAQNFGEDLPFVRALRDAGASVRHADDDTGLVVHLLHDRNSSVIFPQYRLPRALGARLFPGLADYLCAIRGAIRGAVGGSVRGA
jgi:glycosyltransferase involved in cell wall biosynthesis